MPGGRGRSFGWMAGQGIGVPSNMRLYGPHQVRFGPQQLPLADSLNGTEQSFVMLSWCKLQVVELRSQNVRVVEPPQHGGAQHDPGHGGRQPHRGRLFTTKDGAKSVPSDGVKGWGLPSFLRHPQPHVRMLFHAQSRE